MGLSFFECCTTGFLGPFEPTDVSLVSFPFLVYLPCASFGHCGSAISQHDEMQGGYYLMQRLEFLWTGATAFQIQVFECNGWQVKSQEENICKC